ncbi:MAG: hypothetical protein CME66_08585 [Halobacteriovoraceae bacterium]|nr:hypothetical protein [Halobacteriovoraceae bacterium]
MRKLLEIELNDEIKKSILTVYAFSLVTFLMFFITRVVERSVFNLSFLIEITFVVVTLKFYARAFTNRNYALWGLTLVLTIYILMNILHYTFFEYNIFVLYLAFLAALFLGLNGYLMSSPLYFPRIQWWEYDFRYRGELKADIVVGKSEVEVRVADIRRECISFLAFEILPLGDIIELKIPYKKKVYQVSGKLKTQREDIPGRPIRYGMKLELKSDVDKKQYTELKKIWGLNKKANIRRKFADYTQSQEKSEL